MDIKQIKTRRQVLPNANGSWVRGSRVGDFFFLSTQVQTHFFFQKTSMVQPENNGAILADLEPYRTYMIIRPAYIRNV